jgi:hypothetical protein
VRQSMLSGGFTCEYGNGSGAVDSVLCSNPVGDRRRPEQWVVGQTREQGARRRSHKASGLALAHFREATTRRRHPGHAPSRWLPNSSAVWSAKAFSPSCWHSRVRAGRGGHVSFRAGRTHVGAVPRRAEPPGTCLVCAAARVVLLHVRVVVAEDAEASLKLLVARGGVSKGNQGCSACHFDHRRACSPLVYAFPNVVRHSSNTARTFASAACVCTRGKRPGQ